MADKMTDEKEVFSQSNGHGSADDNETDLIWGLPRPETYKLALKFYKGKFLHEIMYYVLI